MSEFVYSIGFTKTSAERFFERLRISGVSTVIDVRLHNTSQLAGFAKSEDLSYFLQKIGNIGYRHMPLLAPDGDMLSQYRSNVITWDSYEKAFTRLMADRRIEEKLSRDMLTNACLLCSEDKPHRCHRRLVLEYLNQKWDTQLLIRHL